MRILLDECLPVDFRHSFSGHVAHREEWAGLKGKKNGELLHAAEVAGYQVLLTVDQGIPRQQTIVGRKLSTILIRSRTNQMEEGIRVRSARPECPSSVLGLTAAPCGCIQMRSGVGPTSRRGLRHQLKGGSGAGFRAYPSFAGGGFGWGHI